MKLRWVLATLLGFTLSLACDSSGDGQESSSGTYAEGMEVPKREREKSDQTKSPSVEEKRDDTQSLGDRLSAARVVDLTHDIHADMPVFPGSARYERHNAGSVEDDGYYINRFEMSEHVGTHVDAPAHFIADQSTMEELEAGQLVGRAAVIDIAEQVSDNPDYTLKLKDLHAWEDRHGKLSTSHVVLIRTGWASRWPDEARFRNADDAGVMHFPGISVQASKLLRRRGVRGIGIDTLSTDPGNSNTFAQHKDFLKSGGFHIENLANLDRLPATGAFVVVAALPLNDGSGAPARVLAFVPPSDAP